MIPLIFVVAGIIYLFGIRHYRKVQKREEAADRFDALDWDDEAPPPSTSSQRLDSFYVAQKPKYARSNTTSSLSTITQNTAYKGQEAETKNPFNEHAEEYIVDMQAVPVVKDASYILPPSDNGDDWGYQDPVTKKPGRIHSPGMGSGLRPPPRR